MWYRTALFLALLVAGATTSASATGQIVAMKQKGFSTFYVAVTLPTIGTQDFLVDTGASYTVLGKPAMTELVASGDAEYLRDLQGRLANGARMTVPLYRLERMSIGGDCILRNVEVAVFPKATRPILGIRALGKAAPFRFSVVPPTLELSGCGVTSTAAIESSAAKPPTR